MKLDKISLQKQMLSEYFSQKNILWDWSEICFKSAVQKGIIKINSLHLEGCKREGNDDYKVKHRTFQDSCYLE